MFFFLLIIDHELIRHSRKRTHRLIFFNPIQRLKKNSQIITFVFSLTKLAFTSKRDDAQLIEQFYGVQCF